MANFAIVENETKKVVNLIVWDGAECLPPRNHFVIQSDVANIDDTYNPDTQTFYKSEEA